MIVTLKQWWDGSVDLKDISLSLNKSEYDVHQLIQSLKATKKIQGELQDTNFILESTVESFIHE